MGTTRLGIRGSPSSISHAPKWSSITVEREPQHQLRCVTPKWDSSVDTVGRSKKVGRPQLGTSRQRRLHRRSRESPKQSLFRKLTVGGFSSSMLVHRRLVFRLHGFSHQRWRVFSSRYSVELTSQLGSPPHRMVASLRWRVRYRSTASPPQCGYAALRVARAPEGRSTQGIVKRPLTGPPFYCLSIASRR